MGRLKNLSLVLNYPFTVYLFLHKNNIFSFLVKKVKVSVF